MKKISVLLLFHILISCTSKPDLHKKHLLAIESVMIYQGCTMDIQAKYIVRYNFENGQLVSKDTLNTNNKGISDFQIKLFRQTSDSVFIYKNKYIISSRGVIFDMGTKKFSNVNQTGVNGHPVELSKEYINDIYEETGYLLKRESYYPTRGILSPDKKHGLQTYNLMNVQPTINPGEILLFDSTNTQQTIVHTGGMGTYISNAYNQQAHIPVYWLDNRTFMYAKYLFPVIDSMTDIEIHKVDIHNESDEKLCTINRVSKAKVNARFYKDAIGNLLFIHNEIVYQLNKKSNTISEIHYEEQGNGFKTEISFLHFLNKKEQSITFNDQSIGRFYYLNSSAKTSEGYIAIAALEEPICAGNDMKIWNTYTKEWITIHSFARIIPIGWIEE